MATYPNPYLALALFCVSAIAGAVAFWPGSGVVARFRRARRLTRRVLAEDALKHIAKHEMDGRTASLDSIAGALGISRDRAAGIVDRLVSGGMVETDGVSIRPSDEGLSAGVRVIRAHRLFERYLADETGYGEAEWHALAEMSEHELDPEEAEALAMQLGQPNYDPHGDPIPDSAGAFRALGGRPLSSLAAGDVARIVHVEDEPDAVYAQLVAEGIRPGQSVRVTEVSGQRIRAWIGVNEHVLAPVVAANVTVVVHQDDESEAQSIDGDRRSLADLGRGDSARVHAIVPACRGAQRRRLMDLGMLPGTEVTAELVSPSGDPTAYRVRGALIALRADQASLILVTDAGEKAP